MKNEKVLIVVDFPLISAALSISAALNSFQI